MSELGERVARAMWGVRMKERERNALPIRAWDHPDVNEYAKKQTRDDARAAIAAVREPTDAMLDVARRDEHEALVKACADIIAEMQINRTGTIDDQARAAIAACGVEELRAEVERLTRERNEVIQAFSEASRKQGEAEGKLLASEMPGIVEGWRARAKKAERERDEARSETLGRCEMNDYKISPELGAYLDKRNAEASELIALRAEVAAYKEGERLAMERMRVGGAERDATIARLAAGVADLVAALEEARLQIAYLHEKFGETGSGNGVLAHIDAAIAS